MQIYSLKSSDVNAIDNFPLVSSFENYIRPDARTRLVALSGVQRDY